MRFINFINESDYAQILTLDKCKELLQKKCSKNLELTKQGKILYRGDENANEKFIFLDKSKRKPRKSANTLNYYTILTSELLPQWKKFPRRDMGVICTTYRGNASNYGKVYKIIPFDDAKIAMCPDDDFWSSFIKWPLIGGPAVLNNMMDDLGVKDTKSSISSFMKKKIVDFKGDEYYLSIFKLNYLRFFKNIHITNSNAEKMLNTRELEIMDATFGDLLEKMYDPEFNDFELISSLQDIKNNKEVWFDGSAIMISNEIDLQDI